MDTTQIKDERDVLGMTLIITCRVCDFSGEPKYGVAKCPWCGSWNVKPSGEPFDKRLDRASLSAVLSMEAEMLTKAQNTTGEPYSGWSTGWLQMADFIIEKLDAGGDIERIINAGREIVLTPDPTEEQIGGMNCVEWTEGNLGGE